MSYGLEEQLGMLPIKFPDQTNLVTSIQQTLKGMDEMLPLLQQAKEQIQRTQQCVRFY